MKRALPSELQAVFTSEWHDSFDGLDITWEYLRDEGYDLFPWKIDSNNPWWGRPLKLGEVGCTLAHLACWRHAMEKTQEPLVMILEDNVEIPSNFLHALMEGLNQLKINHYWRFDLLYLGRYPLEPDRPCLPGFVIPGYSHCSFGYLLTRQAVGLLLETQLNQAIVPIDEFLPSMYMDHPRSDLNKRFPPQLTALAFNPPLVTQLPKDQEGSDTENSEFVDW